MVAGVRSRFAAAMLAVAVLLAGGGVVALVFQPVNAGANVTPGVAPDFTVAAGDTQTETYDTLLVGSVEVKGNAESCRNDSTTALTCAAHRIKLNRTPGAKLTIVVEWDAQAADILSVPDVDIFLFDAPTSSLDYAEVGGAGQTMPEQIDTVPTQDEYDLVVQAYAGVVAGYKITVFYGLAALDAGGGGDEGDGVTPDIVLTPHAKPFIKEYLSTLAPNPALAYFPEGCRTDPTTDPFCDVFRIKLNRSKAKGAVNYVVISLEWTNVEIPDIQTPLTGLGFGHMPNMQMYVYDKPDHSLDGAGGTTLAMPERVGFVATQDEYDLVIQSATGPSTGYKITAFMTDELFGKPFELLDPITGAPVAPAFDPQTGAFDPTKLADPAAPPLALAPIDVDDQIAGIGLGTTEQFDREEALRMGQQALRDISVSNDPPSALILVLTLVVLPTVLFGAGVVIMRRRHHVAF